LKVTELIILPGKTKSGKPESFERIVLKPGDIVSIVGPTGSGKSQLLYDISVLARGDTVSRRRILVNGEMVPRKLVSDPRFSLVGHVSQSLKFYLDLSVREFLELHAEIYQKSVKPGEVIDLANKLTGEPITEDMNLQELSGGQSRALMIADILLIRDSPILLADELENAGINKLAALELFASKRDRIVFFVTHDPLIALSSKVRLVMRNGGIYRIVKTTDAEKALLEKVKDFEKRLIDYIEKLRAGETLA
jgi:ABC-type lipoprotein export system ATPase subunit